MDDDQKLLFKLNRRTRFTQFLVWIALFFTAIGIAAGYKNWLRIHEKAKAGLVGVAEIREKIPTFADKEQVLKFQKNINLKLDSNQKHIDGALVELRQIQDSTQHIADTVYNQIKTLTIQQESVTNSKQASKVRDWSLAEIHFLLQTAVQVFTLKQDKEGAIKAMSMADDLLLKRGSTSLLPLRKQISHDLSLIRQYKKPDTSLLSEKISDLQALLKPKDLTGKKEKNVTIKNKNKQEDNLETIESEGDSIVERVKKTINQAVVVHKFDKPLQNEMNLETKKSLFHLLSLRLETLRLMLFQGKDKSYHKQIVRIKKLLENFYSNDVSKPLIERLNDLDSVDLTPNLPDITKSLSLLDEMKNKGNLN